MALINKYRYLQAILIGLPIGLISLYFGVKNIVDIKQDIEDYPYTSGNVDSIYVEFLYISKSAEYPREVLCLKVNENVYYLTYGKHRLLINKYLAVGDTICLWFQEKSTGNKKIKGIKKDEKDIIKYEPGGYWVGIVFIIWGLFWVIVSGLYIFKHPEDLLGGEES